MDKIQPNRMDRGFQKYQEEFEAKALEVLRSGWESYILALILQPGLSSQASLYFISQGINPS